MKLNLKLTLIVCAISIGLDAQIKSNNSAIGKRTCHTAVPSAEWDSWFNKKVDEYKQDKAIAKAQSPVYTIPVIVHVIYGATNTAIGTYPNLSSAQINSQIKILNNDFAGVGLNVGNLAATAFSALGAADCKISFCLAQLDTNGNFLTEPGIDRISYISQGWSNPNSFNTSFSFQNYIDGIVKPSTIWNPTRYLNIWLTDHNSFVNILGFATFPIGTGLVGIFNGNGTALTDGVYCWSNAFGNVGTLDPVYNQGRTATHEVGHWLGLRHTWGDATCGDDYCSDVPIQNDVNFGCPMYPSISATPCVNSPNGDMFMNFMDYGNDPCLYMFTPDQSARMTTAMINGTYRNQLTASSATLCNVVASAPIAIFSMTNSACVDSIVTLNNQSTGTQSLSYSWFASPNTGVSFSPSANVENPTVNFTSQGSYTISVAAANLFGSNTSSKPIVVGKCSSTSTVNVGIKENSLLEKSIHLSPNPSTGLVNISTHFLTKQTISIKLHNCLGQFVREVNYKDVTNNNYTLDLNDAANGIYFVTISNGEEQLIKRLILNR
jgi:hypothetical protein